MVSNVLNASSFSSSFLINSTALLPLSFSFVSGMVAAVNPCGFVMLPGYLSLFLLNNEKKKKTTASQIINSLRISTALGVGFIVVFGITGLIVSTGGIFITSLLPWVNIFLGLCLVAVGTYMIAGRQVYFGVPQKLSALIANDTDYKFKSFFLYGISYGIASISCTLPIFMSLITNSIATGGFFAGLMQYIIYSLGMTLVVAVLTVMVGFVKNVNFLTTRTIRSIYHPIASALTILIGLYLIIYWVSENKILL